MTDKLNIRYEMAQFDAKNRNFYSDLTDEERKKFSNYLMIRWGSAVQGPGDLQAYYVQSCNHYLNKHFFTVNKHPQLQWLMASAVSPGTGKHDHPWIATKKKDKGNSEVKKTLMRLYPNMKMSDIDALTAITDRKDLKAYIKAHGNED